MFKENLNNTYFTTETYNQHMIHYLNPFHPMFNMKVTIEYPLIPDYSQLNEKLVIPEVNLGDIFAIMPHIRDELDKMNDLLVMFEFLLKMAKNIVVYEIVKDETMYQYLVALHTAHHITMHIRDLKDEANLISLNNEDVEKNYYIKDLTSIMEHGKDDTFYLTTYGKRFLEIYIPLMEWSFKGSINRRRMEKR